MIREDNVHLGDGHLAARAEITAWHVGRLDARAIRRVCVEAATPLDAEGLCDVDVAAVEPIRGCDRARACVREHAEREEAEHDAAHDRGPRPR